MHETDLETLAKNIEDLQNEVVRHRKMITALLKAVDESVLGIRCAVESNGHLQNVLKLDGSVLKQHDERIERLERGFE